MTFLDGDVLIADAQASTGLTDLGDDTLPVRVALVVDRLNSAKLGQMNSRAAAFTINGLMTSRLHFVADHARLPLAAERITAPLFATGEPRSGTTLLHALLAEDEDSRALRFWEVMYPSPPPGPAGVDDPRREQADADWREILDRIPPWIVSHPYNDLLGDGLPECERTWAFDFRSTNPSAWWRVPLQIQNFPQDHHAQYALHRMMLQHVQQSRPPKRWVLKAFHGRRLRALFDTYPDARIVWVHRDPVQVLASQVVAFGQINESLAGSLDWTQFASDTIEGSRANFHAYLTDPLVDDPRIHHVRYRDFVADPVARSAVITTSPGSRWRPTSRRRCASTSSPTPTTGTASSPTPRTSCRFPCSSCTTNSPATENDSASTSRRGADGLRGRRGRRGTADGVARILRPAQGSWRSRLRGHLAGECPTARRRIPLPDAKPRAGLRLALETKGTRYPTIHPFCGPSRKLGGDNADFVYLQAWIDGASTYRIAGDRGTARFINFTVQGPRPEKDVYYGADHPNLHEPFGDIPEANITGDDLATEPDGSFVLYVGGARRELNWLPTTPGSRKLFMRQGFDSWAERSAQFSIERIDMDEPRPVPTPKDLIASMQWAGDFLTGVMKDWPDRELQIRSLFGEPEPNVLPGARFTGTAEQRDARRGRLIVTMPWRLGPDEALVFEFADGGDFWMLTNMGAFWNSMDYRYRPVSHTPSRSTIDSDGGVRMVMTHNDPGVHNWIDTQRFSEGYLTMRVIGSRQLPEVSTKVVDVTELGTVLPADTRRVTPEERAAQLRARFDAIRRRFRI